jgi:hypothetical protein
MLGELFSSNSGSVAKFAAIRRALSRQQRLALTKTKSWQSCEL